MNKLTAEKCREQFEEWFKGVEIELRKRGLGFAAVAGVWADMRKAWHASREALEIALPILEQQERGEDSDDTFIIMRNPGKVPFIKRPTCDVAEYLVQLYQHNPEAVCEVITYRYAGASGQWVQDGRELLAELDIEIPAADMHGRGEGEWIEWDGGERPVNRSAIIQPKFRTGKIMPPVIADFWDWRHTSSDLDIIAYRIIPEGPPIRTESSDMLKVNRSQMSSVELSESTLLDVFEKATGMGDLHDFTVELITENGPIKLCGDYRIILKGTHNQPSEGEQ